MDTRIIEQWKERLREMSNYIHDFEQALDVVGSDDEFMSAYKELTYKCGDIIDQVRTPLGGLDDLREAISVRGTK